MSGEEAAYRAQLQQSGQAVLVPSGGSMYPALRSDTDTVMLVMPALPLRRLDVALYARQNGSLILHRVIGRREDGYIFCGDHLRDREYGVTDQQIIGVMKCYYRGDRLIGARSPLFLAYSFLWYLLPPFLTRGVIRLWLLHKK